MAAPEGNTNSSELVSISANGRQVIFIDQRNVNIEDLLYSFAGTDVRLVRCDVNPNDCLRIFPGEDIIPPSSKSTGIVGKAIKWIKDICSKNNDKDMKHGCGDR